MNFSLRCCLYAVDYCNTADEAINFILPDEFGHFNHEYIPFYTNE